MQYVSFFSDITLQDRARFGGKNASLGQMVRDLSALQISVPFGFATTAEAYKFHLSYNNLLEPLKELRLSVEDESDVLRLREVSYQMRQLIAGVPFPEEIKNDILLAYRELSQRYSPTELCDVAVRSSATAEDLPEASFAGQHESFLHIKGEAEVLNACLSCMASLFTDRAIIYRKSRGIDDFSVALSVGVQKMVRSDKASAGVMFTIDPESGHRDMITINSSYGLGEFVVKGVVNPDEFVVHKPTLAKGFKPLIRKLLGAKNQKLVYREEDSSAFSRLYKKMGISTSIVGSGISSVYEIVNPEGLVIKSEDVAEVQRQHFSLTEEEVFQLARMGLALEEHYSRLNGAWMPLDIEWAKDGIDGALYIVQARPETIHGKERDKQTLTTYTFTEDIGQEIPLLKGQAIGSGIASGVVSLITTLEDADSFRDGDILVTDMTDPDWVPLIKRAGALITNRGGRTCHAAIVSREFGILALVGTGDATVRLEEGKEITLDCSRGAEGFVYGGMKSYQRKEVIFDQLPQPPVPLMLTIGDPLQAFSIAALPAAGVGLARVEFIIASMIRVHPLACIYPEKITDAVMRTQIDKILGKNNWRSVYIDLLAESIGAMVAAFYPRTVIVRCSDFKSNEYKMLLGGAEFEPQEENPMLGLRGAARFVDKSFVSAFELECEAFAKVQKVFGLENMALMIPFVRSVTEAERVTMLLEKNGLKRGEHGLQLFMMVEIPENVLALESYAPFFDGFSLGSNDLAQLTLGVDRDSVLVSHLYDERRSSVEKLISMALEKAKELKKPIGICGQAPSDFPEFGDFLIEHGISSISLSPDSFMPFLMRKNKEA